MTTALGSGKSGIDPFSSNFYKLCTRSSGERFYVREGTLHQLDMSNFSTKIWYLFHRSQVQKEVKEVALFPNTV